MAHTLTLGSLVTLCRQRCGNDLSGPLDDPEYKSLISEVYGELHAMTAEKGARYFQTEATITTTGAVTYALPSNHLDTIGVDRILSGTTGLRAPVYGPISPQERTRLMGLSGPASRFGIEGANLALYPVPPSGTYMHLYVPQPTDYSTSVDTTSIDLLNIYGRKFVIWAVASIAQHKGTDSQQRAVDEAAKALAQVEYLACLRAAAQPSYCVPDLFDRPRDPFGSWTVAAP